MSNGYRRGVDLSYDTFDDKLARQELMGVSYDVPAGVASMNKPELLKEGRETMYRSEGQAANSLPPPNHLHHPSPYGAHSAGAHSAGAHSAGSSSSVVCFSLMYTVLARRVSTWV
jgi:hypothetical protein